MSHTGIKSLDDAPERAAEWINRLSEWLGGAGQRKAYLVLRTVLHAVRDWLSVDEAAQLAAQMPLLIKGVFFDGWNPSATPAANRTRKDFVERVSSAFTKEPLDDVEGAIATVFALLEERISDGEIDDVRNSMKRSLQDLWP